MKSLPTIPKLFLSVLTASVISACSQEASTVASTPTTAIPSDQFGPQHVKTQASFETSGGICPVDSVNRQPPNSGVLASKAVAFGVDGWSATESPGRPVPPKIFAALSGSQGTYYLEGKRKPRPDVAKGDHLLDLAGFEVAGYLANVPSGDYQLQIVTGDDQTLIVCKTSINVHVAD